MNLADHIIMRRAAHVISTVTSDDSNARYSFYYSPFTNDKGNIIDSKAYIGIGEEISKVLFQRRLEDMFRLVFEGCGFTRILAVDKEADDFKSCNVIPMYLLEVFEPSHCFVPIYVTDESILAVSPFNNLAIERVSKNPYLLELIPTSILLEAMTDPGLEKLNTLLEEVVVRLPGETEDSLGEGISRRTFIADMVLLFNEGVKKQDALLTRGYNEVSADLVEEVSTESVYFKKMRTLFSMEEFDKGEELSDGVIAPTDFMPIYVTHKGDSGFAILQNKLKDDGKVVTSLAIKPHVVGVTNTNGIKAILTKDNIAGKKYFILELHDFHYVGNNKIVHYNYMDGHIEEGLSVIDMFSTAIDDPTEYNVGTEGIKSAIKSGGDAIKNAFFVLKKFGIKHGSYVGGLIVTLFKQVGVKNAKWLLSEFGATFRRGVDLEKADTLELQEKLLNDELDSIEERVVSYSKTWLRSISLSVFMGGLIYFPLAWLVSRHRTKKARVNAIERLEVRFDNIIERIDRKINYAEERSENESVDSLLKEKQMYQMARMRLLKLKDDAYNKGRVKYATFDKDLTLTSSQRLDAYLTRGGNLD